MKRSLSQSPPAANTPISSKLRRLNEINTNDYHASSSNSSVKLPSIFLPANLFELITTQIPIELVQKITKLAFISSCATTSRLFSIVSSSYSDKQYEHFFEYVLKPIISSSSLEFSETEVTLNANSTKLNPMPIHLVTFPEFIDFVDSLRKGNVKLGKTIVDFYHETDTIKHLLLHCSSHLIINDEEAYFDSALLRKLMQSNHLKNITIPLNAYCKNSHSLIDFRSLSHLTLSLSQEDIIDQTDMIRIFQDMYHWTNGSAERRLTINLILSPARIDPLIVQLAHIADNSMNKINFHLIEFDDFHYDYIERFSSLRNYVTNLTLYNIAGTVTLEKLKYFWNLEEINGNLLARGRHLSLSHERVSNINLEYDYSLVESIENSPHLEKIKPFIDSSLLTYSKFSSTLQQLNIKCRTNETSINLPTSLKSCVLDMTYTTDGQLLPQIGNTDSLINLKSLDIRIHIVSTFNKIFKSGPVQNLINTIPSTNLASLKFQVVFRACKPSVAAHFQTLNFKHLTSLEQFDYFVGIIGSIGQTSNLLFPYFNLSFLPPSIRILKLDAQAAKYINSFPTQLQQLDLNIKLLQTSLQEFWKMFIVPLKLSVLNVKVKAMEKLKLSLLMHSSLTSFSLELYDTSYSDLSEENTIIELPTNFPDRLLEMKLRTLVYNHSIALEIAESSDDSNRILLDPEERFTWVINESLQPVQSIYEQVATTESKKNERTELLRTKQESNILKSNIKNSTDDIENEFQKAKVLSDSLTQQQQQQQQQPQQPQPQPQLYVQTPERTQERQQDFHTPPLNIHLLNRMQQRYSCPVLDNPNGILSPRSSILVSDSSAVQLTPTRPSFNGLINFNDYYRRRILSEVGVSGNNRLNNSTPPLQQEQGKCFSTEENSKQNVPFSSNL